MPLLIQSVIYLCRIVSLAVFIRALLSWFLIGGYNRFVMVLDDATEPILFPLRRAIPLIGRFDISPIVAILILTIIPEILARIV